MTELSARFTCDVCFKAYRWKPELAGRRVKCACGRVMTAPSAPAAVGVSMLVQAGIMLATVFVVAKVQGISFGPVPTAIVKLCGISIGPGAIGSVIGLVLGFLPFIGALVGWIAGFILYFACIGA